MTPEQKAAFIYAQSVSAYAEIEGMKALNKYREMRGETIAYDEASFCKVSEQFGLGHNSLIEFFND